MNIDGGRKTAGGNAIADGFGEAGLEKRRLPVQDAGDFVVIAVDADHAMAEVAEAGRRDAAHVAEADHSNTILALRRVQPSVSHAGWSGLPDRFLRARL